MPRYTLLDKVLEGVQLSARKGVTSRVMFAAKCTSKEFTKQHQMNHQAEMLQKACGSVALEKVSGCLLVYPTCVLHMVEGDPNMLFLLLKLLQTSQTLESKCVLSFSEDVPYRAFPAWFCAYVSATNLGPYEALSEEQLTSTLAALNLNMLRWGALLSSMNKENQGLAIDSLKATAGELLPDNPASIHGIIQVQGIPTLAEFLQICLEDKDSIYDAELIWPIHHCHPFWRGLDTVASRRASEQLPKKTS